MDEKLRSKIIVVGAGSDFGRIFDFRRLREPEIYYNCCPGIYPIHTPFIEKSTPKLVDLLPCPMFDDIYPVSKKSTPSISKKLTWLLNRAK